MVKVIKEIEEPILSRDFVSARREIKKYLKYAHFSEESRLWAAIYYRWIGEIPKALRLLSKNANMRGLQKASLTKIRIHMELARLLTYLGAEAAGLRITERINFLHPGKAKEQSAYIYFWHELSEKALEHFKQFAHLSEADLLSKNSFDDRTRMIFAGSCYSKLGQFERAESIFKKVLGVSNEPLMIVTAYTFRSQHYFLKKNYEKALKESYLAIRHLKNMPESAAQKTEAQLTHAINLILTKKYPEAVQILDELQHAHDVLGVTPQHWVDVLFLRGLLDFKITGKFSEYWQDVLVYPSSNIKTYAEKIGEYCEVPSSLLIKRGKIDSRKRSVHFDIAADTVTFRNPDHTENHKFGMDLMDLAVCILSYAGERGVSQYLFYDILWNGDLSLDQSKRRIAQLIKRLRQQGYSITCKNSKIRMNDFSQVSCTWSKDAKRQGSVFLERHPKFRRKELEKFFSLSKSSALTICESWLSKNLVKRLATGRESLYEVV